MAQTTECTLLAAEFDTAANQLYAAATAPMRMIATLNGMIKHAADSALATTDAMFDAIADSLGLDAIQDTLASLENGLTALINCSTSIANNPLIQAAVGTDLASIGSAQNVSGVIGMTKELAINTAKQNALNELDKGMSALGMGGQMANTQMRYQQMLKSAGILDTIDLMDDIATCLTGLCPMASLYRSAVDQGLEDVNLNPDQTAKDIFSAVDTAKKTLINDTIARGQALESQINNWSGGKF